MFKSELAKLAGVSNRTFRRYLATRRAILTAMGVSPFARKLPPQAVHDISEDYCIDLPPNFYKKKNFTGSSGLKGTRPFPNVVPLQMKPGRRSPGIFGPSRPFERPVQIPRTSHRDNPLGGIEITRTNRSNHLNAPLR